MHSTLLQMGPFTLKAFGLMMALGFGCAWFAAFRLGRGTHRNADYLSTLLVWMMVAGICGARLAYVAEHWSAEFAAYPAAIVRIDQGGLMFYGGVGGATLALLLFARLRHERLFDLSDLVLAVLPIGHAFGRIGCFLNGCCFGRLSESPLAVTFPPHSPAWITQCGAGLLSPGASQSLPVLPTQLFEAGANLLLFLALVVLYRHTSRRRGLVTACYFLAYPVIRFLIESLRGDERMTVGFWSIGQIISVLLFIAGAALAVWRLRRPADPEQGGQGRPEIAE